MSADKKNKFKSLAIRLCAVGLTVVVGGLAYLYLVPKTYRAVATVEILKSGWNRGAHEKSEFSRDKLPEECQTVRGDGILGQVITNLNLNALWAARLNQGTSLKTEQTRERLRTMLEVQPAENSSVIEIAATGGDPIELAKIVNEIAKLYSILRQTGRVEASHQGISSLRAKWETQNQKVQEAQAEVDKLGDKFNEERATNNTVQVYDAGALQSLRSQYAMIEDDYQNKSNQLAGLKGLDREQLRTYFATNDLETNAMLIDAFQQFDKAKRDLADAQKTQGADAPETKRAERVVQELNSRIDILVGSSVSMRELELSSLKTTLERLREMSEKAGHATTDLKRIAMQDSAYAKAKEHLTGLIQERDELEHEIIGSGSMAAVMPDVITARIMGLADPPIKPVSPDGSIALAAFVTGGIIAGAGVLLLVLLGMKPRGVEKKAP